LVPFFQGVANIIEL